MEEGVLNPHDLGSVGGREGAPGGGSRGDWRREAVSRKSTYGMTVPVEGEGS